MSAGGVFPSPLVRWTARLSAITGAAGVVFLVSMFLAFGAGATSTGQALGRINDVLVLVAYPLVLPSLRALRSASRSIAPREADLATLIGVVAVIAITVLQGLLVADVLTFEQQGGPVSLAFLAFGVSLVMLGDAGRRAGVFPDGRRMGLIGATYFGYPLWAWRVSQPLVAGAAGPGADRSTGDPGISRRSRSHV
jgi:hypothetical protein